jgi:hypothetical protein
MQHGQTMQDGQMQGTQATPDATTPMQGQSMSAGSGIVTAQNYETMISADELIDANVYTMNEAYDENTWMGTRSYGQMGTGWEDIGEVDDVVLSADGRMVGLAIETGGWLDIGDDIVLTGLDDVRLVNDNGTVSVVTRMSQEQLESRPELDQNWWSNQ